MIAWFGGRQAGVVSRRQLTRAGVSRREIERRLVSGHLHSLHRGVYAVGHVALGPRSRRFAAWLAVGEDGAISHRSAAAEHGVREDNRSLVDVTSPRRARPRKGVRPHEARLTGADVVVVEGLPVTSLARTLLDLAAERPATEITRAIERAEKLRTLDLAALDAQIDKSNGHRGAGTLTAALAAHDPRHLDTNSGWEREILPHLDALELRPAINAAVGPYVFDLWFARERVAVELDSWEHHRTRRSFEHDRARDRWCALRGIVVMRMTWRQVGGGALAEVAELLRVRAA